MAAIIARRTSRAIPTEVDEETRGLMEATIKRNEKTNGIVVEFIKDFDKCSREDLRWKISKLEEVAGKAKEYGCVAFSDRLKNEAAKLERYFKAAFAPSKAEELPSPQRAAAIDALMALRMHPKRRRLDNQGT